jgi:hypothetical protein
MDPLEFGRGICALIIAPMTQARTRAKGLATPSLSQLLLTAMLRMFVALVQSVVSTFQMKRNRPLRDWHTGSAQASLPRTKSDTQQQETQPVGASDIDSSIALVSC